MTIPADHPAVAGRLLEAALDGAGIVCPPLDGRLLDTYLDRLLADGLLPEPAGAGTTP